MGGFCLGFKIIYWAWSFVYFNPAHNSKFWPQLNLIMSLIPLVQNLYFSNYTDMFIDEFLEIEYTVFSKYACNISCIGDQVWFLPFLMVTMLVCLQWWNRIGPLDSYFHDVSIIFLQRPHLANIRIEPPRLKHRLTHFTCKVIWKCCSLMWPNPKPNATLLCVLIKDEIIQSNVVPPIVPSI